MSSPIRQLGYLGLAVKNLAAWRALAVDALGLMPAEEETPGRLLLRMDERHHRLCLHERDQEGLLYLGWQVQSAIDLERAAEMIAQAGFSVEEATVDELAERKVAGMLKVTDPCGFPLEVFYGPYVPVHRPFQPMRAHGGFRTGPQGLGHALLSARDIAAVEHFYTAALGFRVTDYGANGAVFLRCNPRHHSVGFRPVLVDGDQEQLQHILFEVNRFDDVGSVYGACEDGAVPIAVRLGRHSNDLEVSFYVYTPSPPLQIEYGWSTRLIEDPAWTTRAHDRGSLWGHERVDTVEREANRARSSPAYGRFPWLA